MAQNYWLYKQLSDIDGLIVEPNFHDLITIKQGQQMLQIYCPESDEYIITMDIVRKVMELGGDTISYATSWCRASQESISFGERNGVQVLPHKELLEQVNLWSP